ncbi:hypothetical protein GPECTOR_32g489 [Gonium pectorale]|uniref:Uncharacterized protein n=1 Tax=Gonium pectorale TaxID=33097 RepID=A0A150GDG5_GONPE|nr:hypothetical protein GPECTOR_32g489 [Gonium pectorale]|eukprot:KXZ47876.1 hypothetical protein GPECTOR_32g489 [Gonium pectorale]
MTPAAQTSRAQPAAPKVQYPQQHQQQYQRPPPGRYDPQFEQQPHHHHQPQPQQQYDPSYQSHQAFPAQSIPVAHPPSQQAYSNGYQRQAYTSGPAAGAGPAPTAPQGAELERVNPITSWINSVALMGTIHNPEMQGRSTKATIHVPFKTKPGTQAFIVEAWDSDAGTLANLHGAKVVVDGRLAIDSTVGVKVVAYRFKLVDEQLAPSSVRAGAGSRISTPREPLDPQKVWKVHYETDKQGLKDLAVHFGCSQDSVSRVLLGYAVRTQSPLRWGALAQEAGLAGAGADISLMDFINVVTSYRESFAAVQANAQPGASPPSPPETKDGTLRVKPIRDWALALGVADLCAYAVGEFQKKHGENKTYNALRLAVVAEATMGHWDASVEFPSGH